MDIKTAAEIAHAIGGLLLFLHYAMLLYDVLK